MEEVDLEEAIARLKLCMGMSLHGGEQTIVNIKDLEKVLKVHQELQDEFFWQQVRITNEFILKSKVEEKIEEYKQVIEITEEQLKHEENVDVRRRLTTTIEQATAGILALEGLLRGE